MEHVDFSQEGHDKFIGRMMKNFVRASCLLDHALIHDHHPVRDLQGFLLVMGDKNTGKAELFMQVSQPGPQFCPDPCVKGAKGLIQQQYAWFNGQGSCQSHTLALTT